MPRREVVVDMKHPCAGCKAKSIQGRVTCSILWREIVLEGCNNIRGKSPKKALEHLERVKEKYNAKNI